MDIKLNQIVSKVAENLELKYKVVSNYYYYKNIKNTARIKNGILYVRVSDKLKDSPETIKEALSYVLLSKIKGTRVAPRYKRIYDDYVHKIILNDSSDNPKGIHEPKGTYFDLDEIFQTVNDYYFFNEISKPCLRWSKKRAYRILGRYDRSKNEIIISKLLDCEKTPKFVVEYIMYHEMLHIKFGFTYKRGRRKIHTQLFKKEEEKFPFYKESIDYLKKISGSKNKYLF